MRGSMEKSGSHKPAKAGSAPAPAPDWPVIPASNLPDLEPDENQTGVPEGYTRYKGYRKNEILKGGNIR